MSDLWDWFIRLPDENILYISAVKFIVKTILIGRNA